MSSIERGSPAAQAMAALQVIGYGMEVSTCLILRYGRVDDG